MDIYAGILPRILGDHSMEGQYDPGSGLVYLFHEDENGCVCNLFSCSGATLESRLISTMSVAGEDTRMVRARLSAINRRLDWGGFYVDSVTGCIAYALDYPLPASGLRYGDACLARFCTQAWQNWLNYRGALSRLTRQLYVATGEADRGN
ncbi:hypothetical protein JCM30204_08450 [Dysgonomonas termitidis]